MRRSRTTELTLTLTEASIVSIVSGIGAPMSRLAVPTRRRRRSRPLSRGRIVVCCVAQPTPWRRRRILQPRNEHGCVRSQRAGKSEARVHGALGTWARCEYGSIRAPRRRSGSGRVRVTASRPSTSRPCVALRCLPHACASLAKKSEARHDAWQDAGCRSGRRWGARGRESMTRAAAHAPRIGTRPPMRARARLSRAGGRERSKRVTKTQSASDTHLSFFLSDARLPFYSWRFCPPVLPHTIPAPSVTRSTPSNAPAVPRESHQRAAPLNVATASRSDGTPAACTTVAGCRSERRWGARGRGSMTRAAAHAPRIGTRPPMRARARQRGRGEGGAGVLPRHSMQAPRTCRRC